MSDNLLCALEDFLYAYGTNRIAPYDWSFKEQEAWEKLLAALKAERGEGEGGGRYDAG